MRHYQVSFRLSARRLLTAVVGTLTVECADPVQRTTAPSGAPGTPPPVPTLATIPYIYLADADGTVRGRLTVGMWPSWSPDGRRILFERDWNVWVIDADGSNERQLVAGRWPTWAPDGATIAFVAEKRILVMNADSLGARTLMTPALNIMSRFDEVGNLDWSPDGKTIAFQTLSMDWPSKIILINADGSAERGLTSLLGWESRNEDGATWSPDGSRLLFWSTDAGLQTVDRTGGTLTTVYTDVEYGARAAWSPDGRTITFNTGGSNPSIVRVPANGGVATPFIADGREADWSPDGKRIAFVRAHLR